MQNLIETRETLNEYILDSPKLKLNKDMEKSFKGINKIIKTKTKQFDKADKAEKDGKDVNTTDDSMEEPQLN